MLGQLGLKLFTVGLFALIVLYHFFAKIWMLSWVPLLCWALVGTGFLLWFIFSIEWIIKWFQKRSSQFGISVVVSTIAILGILGAANWLAVEKNYKKDLTRHGLHSLSEQSINVLSGLKEEIALEVWTVNIKSMSGSHDMERFLDNYVQKSSGKLKLKIRNPNTERLEAIDRKVTRNDVIIARSVSSGRESRIENFNDGRAEEQITNAIVQAVKGRKKTLCFLSGHGELSTKEEAKGLSLSLLKESLENSSYTFKEISLITEKSVPADCESLVSVGPRSVPSSNEVDMINAYLSQGGKLLALWGLETPHEWQSLISSYGVKLEDNILVDPRVQGAPAVYTKNYAYESDIVKNFSTPILLVLARGIEVPTTAPAGVSIKAVVSTENGTLATLGDLKSLKGGSISASNTKAAGSKAVVVEIKKNISVAGTAEKDKKESSIVVIGNHMIASNGLATQYGNMDFMLNTVSYLMKDSDLIGIRPKDVKSAKLQITAMNLRQVQGYLLLTTLLFIVLAFTTAFRRKTI